MTDFFEPPVPAPEPPPVRHKVPPWFAPPTGSLPGVVALDLVLARTERAAVCVTPLEAYPSGFALELVTMVSQDLDELDPLLFEGRRMRHRRSAGQAAIPDEMLRFGVEFADGRKATNTADEPLANLEGGSMHRSVAVEAYGAPPGPVLQAGGGGGGGGNWKQSIWIWPLPPPGRLTFVCQWPAAGIELTRHEIEAQLLLDAAKHAQVIFADDDLPDALGPEQPLVID